MTTNKEPIAMRSITRWLAVAVCLFAVTPVTARTITIAVVRDGPSTSDALVPLIEQQLQKLLADDTIVMKTDAEFDAGWQPERAGAVIQAAMRDGSVDYVVGLGMLVTQAAAQPDLELTKPFVSAYDSRADVIELPWSGDGSTKDNLALIVIPQNAGAEIDQLLRMQPIQRIYVAADPAYVAAIENLESKLDNVGQAAGVDIVALPLKDDVAAALEGLDPAVRALYVTGLPRLADAQRRTLMSGLAERGILVFSSEQSDVERGALAAMTPDTEDLVTRRVAINISRLVRGETTTDLPVMLTVESKLLLNARTAAQIGYTPNFEAQAFATILYPEALDPDSRDINIDGAVNQALETNVEIRIKEAQVDVADRRRQLRRGGMFPQINAKASQSTGDQIVSDGFFPTDVGTAGISITQMIYADTVVSRFRSSGHLYTAELADQTRQRLDVINESAQAFLRFSQARVSYRIQRDNVQLTQDNLELSKIRYDVGYSGQDEVFRWQSELAQRRAQMLDSDANVETSRIILNQILGIDQGQRWRTDEINVDVDTYELNGIRVADIIANQRSVDSAREVMLQIAYENSPELVTLDNVREASGIQAGARKRRYFIPAFQLGFQYNYFWEWEPEIAGRQDDTWGFTIAAVYPLFLGNNKYYDMKRMQAVQRSVVEQRELTRQQVERRVRTAQRRLEASFPNILLLQEAADNSGKNLDVVQEKYAQGILNVTDLLSAQNQSFQADQLAAAAVYQFLIDIEEYQRAIAWFVRDRTPEENAEFAQRVRAAYGLQ